ncbi:hypothetical protein [Beggiatoa leptomitoformis]|uniref:Uncharacterized protein n=1 Tax=Beggiatoa leptomitoformis TaxID=288004 RepID=A0A2N9YC15_9GAMM|nr:hypothetical protein [Beggiatoa leptomitoformis]ALG66723.2 hypothetical protein AL038_02040 [Beggiatoa leptomitoformis]AUI67944.2 hypothetical protein BLE401_04000 [Beggiatoa leptomitoformis]
MFSETFATVLNALGAYFCTITHFNFKGLHQHNADTPPLSISQEVYQIRTLINDQ